MVATAEVAAPAVTMEEAATAVAAVGVEVAAADVVEAEQIWLKGRSA
jgi:hypothetical protein